jgi:signal transduction histidine kinase/DNA-binding response OmpR family regulator
MNRLLITLTLITCLINTALPQSQCLFNSGNGLLESRINDISIDRNGMIWVATMDGLTVFDGHNFSESWFPRQNINKIRPLSDSDILIATGDGLWKYNYQRSKFYPIHFEADNAPVMPYVSDIVCNDTMAYIATSGFGLYSCKHGDTVAMPSNIAHLIDTKYIRSLFLDSKDRLWVSAYGDKTYIFRYGARLGTPADIPPDINKYLEDIHGNIYAASNNSGVVIITPGGETQKIALPGIGDTYPVSTILLDGSQLLIGTDGLGLWEYDTQTATSRPLAADDLSFDFGKSKVHAVIKDNDGNLWLALYQKGLMLITKESPIFDNYYYRPNSDKNIGSNSVGAIADCKGEIWIGTEGDGIYIIGNNKTVSHIDITDKHGRPIMTNIISMINSDDQTLWVGTYSNGLIKMDIATRRTLKTYDLLGISSITAAPNGKLLLTSFGKGIGIFDPKTEQYNSGILVNPPWANNIKIDASNNYWIGTYDGLWFVDKDTKTSRKYTAENGYLTQNAIIDIYIDDKGLVWCATRDGIVVINPVNGSRQHLLQGIIICSIVKDKMGFVWASTHDGLYRYDSSSKTFVRFGIEDGLKSSEFASRVGIVMNNGMACFGGTMGVTMIKNDNLAETPSTGEVVLRGVTVNNYNVQIGTQYDGTTILTRNIADADTIYLTESLNYFAIQFATSNPAKLQQTRFQYRMLGFDSTYTQCARGVMQASFTNMKRGTYTLEILANIRNSQSHARRLTIIIHPVWYRTMWAKSLLVIAIATIIYFIYNYYREKFRRRQSEAINEMKMQFFINISHEVRTPLTLIIDPLEKLLSRPNIDAETSRLYKIMKVNSQRILRLVSQLLDLRKIDKGQVMMKFGKTELCSFVREIIESCTPLSDTKEITINLTNNHHGEIFAWIDPENFEKIMLNLINNAIKFAPVGGEIDIDISQYDDEQKIRITVQDNGIGIQQDDIEKIFQRFYQVKTAQNRYTTGTGVGLHLARYLTELHKGRLYAENRKDRQGSRFTVELQMGHSHLRPEDIIEEPENTSQWNAAKKKNTDDKPAVATSRLKTIFIIDDEDSIRTYLSEQLGGEYHTVCFENGKDALDNVIAQNPVLIICDIMMPEMDGWTFCRKIKHNFKTSHIPVILLTALGDEANKAQGIDIGADMYLEKPFNTEFLKKIIKNLIQNREKVTNSIVQKADSYDIESIELKSQDQILMQKVMQIIKDNISHRDLNVEMLADTIGISRVHLHRKIKEITGLSARDYLKNIRMKQASLLLTDRSLTISEIAYAVGYSNPAHFSSSFKAFYGVSPTEYAGRAAKEDEDDEDDDTPKQPSINQ